MPTAYKLPSGSWRCQVCVNHQRLSFVADTKKEAEALASAARLKSEYTAPSRLTFGAAVTEFLSDRSHSMSPSTLCAYKSIQDNHLSRLAPIPLSKLTSADIQRIVNQIAAGHAPKTVRNVYGLITAVLGCYRPDFHPDIKLPQPKKHEMVIPTDAQIPQLISSASSDLRTAIYIAALCGLREGEICALEWSDIDLESGRLSVNKSMAYTGNPSQPYILKSPKSSAGYRTVVMPPPLISYLSGLPHNGDRLISLNPAAVSSSFRQLRRRLGMSVRFHDLRHYYASMLLALGVPDKYAITRLGHSTTYTLQHVYQHLRSEKEASIDTQISDAFSSLLP